MRKGDMFKMSVQGESTREKIRSKPGASLVIPSNSKSQMPYAGIDNKQKMKIHELDN